MNRALPYEYFAVGVMLLHFAVVIFVVGGLFAIVAGNLRGWKWVNRLWFRLLHLITIAVVVVETWLGIACPLTTLEKWLRAKAGVATYDTGFIEHWLGRLLYYNAPDWVFTLGYSLFGLAVIASWWYFPPRFQRRDRPPNI